MSRLPQTGDQVCQRKGRSVPGRLATRGSGAEPNTRRSGLIRCCTCAVASGAGDCQARHRDPNFSHETKLRDLEVVKNVHQDTALVTCLKEQRPTGEAGHVPPCEDRRRRVGQIKLPFGCNVTACAGCSGRRILASSERRRATTGIRSRHRLREQNEDSAEPQCECTPCKCATRAERARQRQSMHY